MECPNCKARMKRMDEQSRGMGNQAFFECPKCGTVALFSGGLLTESWTSQGGQEGGNECHHSDHTPLLTNAL